MSSTRRLLDAWESLRSVTPAQRAIELAAIARPDVATNQIGEWSVGARDGALMGLRSVLFGPGADAVGMCPECSERIEFDIDIDELRSVSVGTEHDEVVLATDGWVVNSRVPRASDLVAIESATSAEDAAEMLWRRCVVSVRHESRPSAVDELPAAVRSSVVERWEQLDPLADVRLDLVCPACGAVSQQAFDVASYVWVEVDGWARRLLADVHVLARAYGWSEDEIVSLSPLRRRCYLEMVAA